MCSCEHGGYFKRRQEIPKGSTKFSRVNYAQNSACQGFKQDLQNLFFQLGLPDSPAEIDAFVQSHQLPPGTTLPEAAFWTPSQVAFLKQSLSNDSDWVGAVDILAKRLA